uniref:Chemokine interleukin-8-like domain-containing protein n=1 Tax=Denticeps clupeoides TaxID=299321 RepID=A0AAY3ZX09_9TELE
MIKSFRLKNLNLVAGLSMDSKESTCCESSSKGAIKKKITACIIQPQTESCPHAYQFFVGDEIYCTDPAAKWIPVRLEQLKKVSARVEYRNITYYVWW